MKIILYISLLCLVTIHLFGQKKESSIRINEFRITESSMSKSKLARIQFIELTSSDTNRVRYSHLFLMKSGDSLAYKIPSYRCKKGVYKSIRINHGAKFMNYVKLTDLLENDTLYLVQIDKDGTQINLDSIVVTYSKEYESNARIENYSGEYQKVLFATPHKKNFIAKSKQVVNKKNYILEAGPNLGYLGKARKSTGIRLGYQVRAGRLREFGLMYTYNYIGFGNRSYRVNDNFETKTIKGVLNRTAKGKVQYSQFYLGKDLGFYVYPNFSVFTGLGLALTSSLKKRIETTETFVFNNGKEIVKKDNYDNDQGTYNSKVYFNLGIGYELSSKIYVKIYYNSEIRNREASPLKKVSISVGYNFKQGWKKKYKRYISKEIVKLF